LTVNPDERLTVDEVSEHEWFKHAGNTPETPLATPTVLTLAAGDETFSDIYKKKLAQGKHLTKPSTLS
jgi:serine/threonine protein kinase